MLKTKVYLLGLLLVLFISCDSPVNPPVNPPVIKNNVEYISDKSLFFYPDDNAYRLFFSLKDKDYINIAAKATINLKILNILDVQILQKKIHITESNFSYWEDSNGTAEYLASVTIPYLDIAEGALPLGNIFCTVFLDDGGSFKEFNLSIKKLPVKNFSPPTDYISANIGILKGIPAGYYKRTTAEQDCNILSEFRIGQHEVTREQVLKVFSTDPSNLSVSSGLTDPVQNINWYQAIAFCNKLSILENLEQVYTVEGVNFSEIKFSEIPITKSTLWNNVVANWENNGYRLPTEIEWRWAAMGADDPENGINKAFAGKKGMNRISDYAWYTNPYDFNKPLTTQPVGLKLPNELDLYDMSGNVGEWIWNCYTFYPEGVIISSSEIGRNGERNIIESKIICGGNWADSSQSCQISFIGTNFSSPENQSRWTGFRVARN